MRALAALAPFLTAPLLDAGLGAAREIGPGGHGSGQYGGMVHHRPEALAALAPSVAEPARGAVLQEALATARSVRTAIGRAETLARLLPHLPVELHPQVVVEVLDALAEPEHPDFPDTRARVVCLVAPHLPGSLQQPALEAALAIRQHDPAPPASALLALAPRLRGLLRERALGEAHEAMQRIDHQPTRAALLLQLAEHTRGAPRRQALREALAAARATDYRLPGAGRALPGLVPHLPPAERDELLDQALAGPGGRATTASWSRSPSSCRSRASPARCERRWPRHDRRGPAPRGASGSTCRRSSTYPATPSTGSGPPRSMTSPPATGRCSSSASAMSRPCWRRSATVPPPPRPARPCWPSPPGGRDHPAGVVTAWRRVPAWLRRGRR